jgi:hypothetical protein
MIDEYYKNLKERFTQIITVEKAPKTFNEGVMHDFFVKNPTCLLGTVMNNKVDGYYIYGDSVFSKISIGNWEQRVPDFIIITYNSAEITFNFIEIEAVNRKIFNGQNDFTADFNHSFTQLEDWKRLFPANLDEMTRKMVVSCFSDLGVYDGARAINAKYILVYGSSDEYKGHEIKMQRLNQKFQNAGFHYISYDRLVNNFVIERGVYTLKYNSSSGGFQTIGWTPYLNYPIGRRRSFGRLENKIDLVNKSEYHDEKQKEILIDSITKLDSTSIISLNESDLGMDFIEDHDMYD